MATGDRELLQQQLAAAVQLLEDVAAGDAMNGCLPSAAAEAVVQVVACFLQVG
jgi:hypothetical protein